MTVGNKQYNEADMMQMQREAEARVREMQARSRKAAEDANNSGFPPPQNRNWSNNSGMFRPRQPRRQWPSQQQNSQQGQRQQQQNRPQPPKNPPEKRTPRPEPPHEHLPPEEAPPKKDGTIIGDIMDALGLDEDYLLIIGLILILINQRADTTLILALAYLLI